jgi:hypothetical protein
MQEETHLTQIVGTGPHLQKAAVFRLVLLLVVLCEHKHYTQDYWLFFFFWTFLSSGFLETRKHNVSESGSFSVLR